jgi:hypothetical protein
VASPLGEVRSKHECESAGNIEVVVESGGFILQEAAGKVRRGEMFTLTVMQNQFYMSDASVCLL